MTLDPAACLLTDRVALVTGAAVGIGEAIALAFARFGAHVAVCDRDVANLDATADGVEAAGRRVVAAELDVRDEAACADFIATARRELGGLDILVNNAGGGFYAGFLDVSAKGQDALLRENFVSVTNCVRPAVAAMGEQGGSIVNLTSIEAHRAAPGYAVYSAMKAAVTNLTKSLALEARTAADPGQLHRAGCHPDPGHRRGRGSDAAAGRRPRRRRRRRGGVPRRGPEPFRDGDHDPRRRRQPGCRRLARPSGRDLRHVRAVTPSNDRSIGCGSELR